MIHPGALLLSTLLAWGWLSMPAHAEAQPSCPTVGNWIDTRNTSAAIAAPNLMRDLAGRSAILLGEIHDNAQHHAWQLHTLAALLSHQPGMAIGFEGFPRAVQPVLDRWIADQMTPTQFLREVDWARNWGYDAKHYMPIFEFARMHRVPLIALNVDKSLVRKVGQWGWRAIPESEREGVGDPEPAPQVYRDSLFAAYKMHSREMPASGTDVKNSPAFSHFVDGMLLWDRAMAEAIARTLRSKTNRLVVAIAGKGHLEHGHGIPRQLAALGVENVAVLLPWELDSRCEMPPAGIADTVFGLSPQARDPDGPRLGIELAADESGHRIRIQRVMSGSIAEASGLRAGDIIERIAGSNVTAIDSVVAAVKRQAPGTWLPLTVTREGQGIDIVAKFPPAE